MKRFLLWIISVALGVVVLLAAVMGVSYAFTTITHYHISAHRSAVSSDFLTK